jgi:hypothetical protein
LGGLVGVGLTALYRNLTDKCNKACSDIYLKQICIKKCYSKACDAPIAKITSTLSQLNAVKPVEAAEVKRKQKAIDKVQKKLTMWKARKARFGG